MNNKINENKIVKLIEAGIPLDSVTPFQELANRAGINESTLILSIKELIDDQKIKRFGPVVSNRRLGINQNAMVTLKVSSELIDDYGFKIAQYDFVTLCYQRDIVPGIWEYNLYFMIHGRDRKTVNAQIKMIKDDLNISNENISILFSSKCFKQKGASY